MRFGLAIAIIGLALSLAGVAEAQSPTRTAASLREQARGLILQGRFADAYVSLTRAISTHEDAETWRELADVADRLRLDERALFALGRYLELRPDASDRAQIEGRMQILSQVLEGGRYVTNDDGQTVRLIHDWDGEPSLPSGRGTNILVDWSGRPLEGRSPRDLLALAEWDGTIRRGSPNAGGLGRRLSRP